MCELGLILNWWPLNHESLIYCLKDFVLYQGASVIHTSPFLP